VRSENWKYRRQVFAIVRSVIEPSALLHRQWISPLPGTHPHGRSSLAIEHEHIHLETSSVLIRELPRSHSSLTPTGAPALHRSHQAGGTHVMQAQCAVANRQINMVGPLNRKIYWVKSTNIDLWVAGSCHWVVKPFMVL
jgi:hypothetical protein